ncbi:bifunctional tetrahydrofolate synthase/dihydrofolate synthase [Marinobacter orientalis]|uniref:Dihydrofolate synthase/folylpolyglutamate synthase n=1 Tax=Marinobacter orientalis TaxID=1928859 RepID=A0A7Y0RCJ1_9GAMM|nr:bifunctional tetrahydrofolate synthase/dihydrofolate synthase [Marinobacter orientalis]NMT63725.1 bifunctional tetrahydrofolate synthase/dihydrofolate synthase [Marinobacter orientalis]TGX49839.1 bifunctional tetrahydrofolate synthase/dihydrofolate synthase [Marinobacter orientalis]
MSPSNDSSARHLQMPGAGATLEQWLAYLESIHPSEIDLGLDRVLLVLRRLFRRNPSARIITVGGTNGKGSAVAALEQLLIRAGRSTGAYTSPHLQHYNERVRINGTNVTDEMLVGAFERVEAARGNTTLTYFEFGTLAAFVLFEQAGVEDWVLEVGLGGRLDAVNVLDPDLAIITSVDIDHVSFLGDNREVIGFEKAGILRPGINAIYADINPPASVLQQVSAQKVLLERPGETYQLVLSGDDGRAAGGFTLRQDRYGDEVRIPDTGLPVHSLAAAVVAIRQLEPGLALSSIERILAELTLPGRYEVLKLSPRVIADVGHNPHAAAWLADRIARQRKPAGRVIAVYAALADKDVEGVARAMSRVVDQWHLAGLAVPRGLGCRELAARLADIVGEASPELSSSVGEGLEQALAEAAKDDLVIVFGSFHTVAQARDALGI